MLSLLFGLLYLKTLGAAVQPASVDFAHIGSDWAAHYQNWHQNWQKALKQHAAKPKPKPKPKPASKPKKLPITPSHAKNRPANIASWRMLPPWLQNLDSNARSPEHLGSTENWLKWLNPLPLAAHLRAKSPFAYQQEVAKLCDEIGNLLTSVSTRECHLQQFSHSGYYSVQKRALVYKDYRARHSHSPKVLVIGGIHGDEYSAYSIIFRWLAILAKEHANLQEHWRLLPAANPDGLLGFKPAQRMNANGVDLNRNFQTSDWRSDAIAYWEERTGKDKRRFPGKDANSEPETVFMSQLIARWQPDVIVSVHAPYGILDFDAPLKTHFGTPHKIGMLHLKLLGTYPGSLGRYAASNRNIPVLTMELPHAGIMPSEEEQAALWADLRRWLSNNLH